MRESLNLIVRMSKSKTCLGNKVFMISRALGIIYDNIISLIRWVTNSLRGDKRETIPFMHKTFFMFYLIIYYISDKIIYKEVEQNDFIK